MRPTCGPSAPFTPDARSKGNDIAVAIPIISAFSTVAAAGSIAAAVSTIGGFLSVAGGIVSGLGLLTGDKGLQKFGGLLSLGSGIANMASAAGGAAGASTVAEQGVAGTAADALQAGADTASLAERVGSLAPPGSELGALDAASAAQTAQTVADTGSLLEPGAQAFGGSMGGTTQSLLERAAAGLTQGDLQAAANVAKSDAAPSLFDQAMGGLNKAGQWIEQNPNTTKLLSGAAEGMWGPEAEAMDFRKSIYQRAQQNLNSPIRLKYQQPARG